MSGKGDRTRSYLDSSKLFRNTTKGRRGEVVGFVDNNVINRLSSGPLCNSLPTTCRTCLHELVVVRDYQVIRGGAGKNARGSHLDGTRRNLRKR